MSIKQWILGAAMMLSVSAFAQNPDAPTVTSKDVIPQGAQLLEMAGKLVTYGRQTKSALPLIQAVQIYHQLNIVDDASNDTASPFSETQILSDATKFAAGNKNLIALINDVQKRTRGGLYDPKYGKLGGPNEPPIRYLRSVKPGESHEHKVSVSSEQYIQILVDGQSEGIRVKDKDGNVLTSDLRLTVYDKQGQTLASDHSKGENCSVCFIPRTSSVITIEIQNVGKQDDNYVVYIYRN